MKLWQKAIIVLIVAIFLAATAVLAYKFKNFIMSETFLAILLISISAVLLLGCFLLIQFLKKR